MSGVIVAKGIVPVPKFLAVDANRAKVEQVDVERVCILPSDVSSPIVSDLCYADCSLRLEDVEDQVADSCPLCVDEEFILWHYALLTLRGYWGAPQIEQPHRVPLSNLPE